MKKLSLLLVAVFCMFQLSGCYFQSKVSGQEIGLKMDNGVSVTEVVGAGRYTKFSPYASLKKIDISTKTIDWVDDDTWTKDKQRITFGCSVSYARSSASDEIEAMWKTYNREAQDDEALKALVLSRLPRVAKQVSTTYTLDQMLGIDESSSKNRDTFQSEIIEELRIVLAESHVTLIDLGINNIGVDPAYSAKMTEKSTAAIEVELAKEKTKQLQEQVKQEEAQTEVAMEIARRNNLVAEEEAKVYSLSPEAYELRRLELLQGVIGETDKIYFIPEGADISLWLAGDNTAPRATGNLPVE